MLLKWLVLRFNLKSNKNLIYLLSRKYRILYLYNLKLKFKIYN
jgi:hypothetical protein